LGSSDSAEFEVMPPFSNLFHTVLHLTLRPAPATICVACISNPVRTARFQFGRDYGDVQLN